MISVRQSRPDDLPTMFIIWHEAVRATHTFLTEADIEFYATQVRDLYLPSQPFWVAVGNGDEPLGFLGITEAKIDALFVHPAQHGRGIGTALVAHATSLADELSVDVNEQNEGACAFYRKLGFRQIGRSELDPSGKPFPILHLVRSPSDSEAAR